MARLAKLPNIVGVKDATNDLARPLRTRAAIGADFAMLSGEDVTALAFMAQGGDGCISVTANVAPRACADMHEAWRKGETAARDEDQRAAAAAARRAVLRDQPGAGEIRRSLLGKSSPEVRLPLVPASAAGARAGPRGDALRRRAQLTNGRGMALRGDEQYVAHNRRARHDYLIEDTLEAGMQLTGTEVKVLRRGLASIAEAYASRRRRRDLSHQRAISPNIPPRASITSRGASASSCCCIGARSTSSSARSSARA